MIQIRAEINQVETRKSNKTEFLFLKVTKINECLGKLRGWGLQKIKSVMKKSHYNR